MDPQVDKPWGGDVACCGIDNRGVALWQDKVVSVTIDGRDITDTPIHKKSSLPGQVQPYLFVRDFPR